MKPSEPVLVYSRHIARPGSVSQIPCARYIRGVYLLNLHLRLTHGLHTVAIMKHSPRILLLTGRMAYSELQRMVSDSPNLFAEALPISVAAFTTPRLVRRNLPRFVSEYEPDIVLVSGMAQGDYSDVQRDVGVPILKGTKKLSTLPMLLKHFDAVRNELSSSHAADVIIQRQVLDELRNRFKALEREIAFGTRNFRLESGLLVGVDLPPRVMAEIVDVSVRPIDTSIADAKMYSKYCDIIDVGASIAQRDPEMVGEIVQEVRKFGVAVSVDSLDTAEIVTAVDAGAEMVLSIDYGNIEVASRIPEEVALVCLPTNVSAGEYPQDPVERASRCHHLCEDLRQSRHPKILADPVLEAAINPGLMKSLAAFHHYRSMDQDTPFLAGFANVTEFLDADSLGVNATLSCLGVELGISVFLTTEERPSTVKCVCELKCASQLAFIAKLLNSPPKELGVTAFAAKSSTHNIQAVPMDGQYTSVEQEISGYTPDPKGLFRIGIDWSSKRILCEHRNNEGKVQRLASQRMHALLKEILNRDLVGSIEHAAYIGAELSKAEIALRLGHDYQQDEDWATELTPSILLEIPVDDKDD